jgi:hypothetical protein
MKTYQFILTITNSTVIEVQAEFIDSAIDLANTEAFQTDVIKSLCNPSDVECSLDLLS